MRHMLLSRHPDSLYPHPPTHRFTPYRNATLTKWHNKTTLSSGGLSMTKQLKAINQGILQQVEHMLADSDKLVERTQLKRIALRPMGKVCGWLLAYSRC